MRLQLSMETGPKNEQNSPRYYCSQRLCIMLWSIRHTAVPRGMAPSPTSICQSHKSISGSESVPSTK